VWSGIVRIVRPSKNEHAVVGPAGQRIEAEFEKVAAPNPKLKRSLEHQPVPQAGMGSEDVRKGPTSFRRTLRSDGGANRFDLALFEWLDPRCRPTADAQ
jgi:hypothetical protein